jgi:hypothetical protein
VTRRLGAVRVVVAIGPAHVPPPDSFLVILRTGWQDYGQVLRFNGVPQPATVPEVLFSLPGAQILRIPDTLR